MAAVRKQAPSFDEKQLSLCLHSPLEQADLVHDHQVYDVVGWLKDGKDRGYPKEWYVLNPGSTPDWLIQHFGIEDLFLTPNEFAGWRRIALLRSLNAVFVDFDIHIKGSNPTQQDIRRLADQKLAKIQSKGWPTPNAIVYSGRGIHLYWLHDKMPKQTLPRWQEITRYLAVELDADKSVTDCTRVLRWIGSINGHTKTKVYGEVITQGRYKFDDLHRQFLPPEKKAKAEIRDIVVARAKREAIEVVAGKKKKSGTKTGSIYQWWYLIYEDLIVIAQHFASDGLPSGKRMVFVELFAHALSWFTVSESLEDEIVFTARMVAPALTQEQVVKETATIVRRAKAFAKWQADGCKKGEEADAKEPQRYKFRRETIFNRLSAFIPVELYPKLRAIVPAHVIKERKAERDKGRWSDHNTGTGVRVGNQEKRALARAMADQGVTQKKIAEELGVAQGTVSKWLKP